MEWGIFWAATTAAATIATAISTGAVLWLKRRQRPWPEWFPTGTLVTRENDFREAGDERDHSKMYGGDIWMYNFGDGTAFNVKVEIKNGTGTIYDSSGKGPGIVEPGEWVRISLETDETPEATQVSVIWLASPTRLGKRWIQTFDLASAADLRPPCDPQPDPKRTHKPKRHKPRS